MSVAQTMCCVKRVVSCGLTINCPTCRRMLTLNQPVAQFIPAGLPIIHCVILQRRTGGKVVLLNINLGPSWDDSWI